MRQKLIIYTLAARLIALVLTAPLLFQGSISGWADPCHFACSSDTVFSALIYLLAVTGLTVIIGNFLVKRAGFKHHNWVAALVVVAIVGLLQTGSTIFHGTDLEVTINDIVYTWGPAIFWGLNVACYTLYVMVEERLWRNAKA